MLLLAGCAENACAKCIVFALDMVATPDALVGGMTAVEFEPTPLRNGALSHRLRPLKTVLAQHAELWLVVSRCW